jgi:S-adenosylmethionine synthetase
MVDNLISNVRDKVKEKRHLNEIIEELNLKILREDAKIKKNDDDLIECKEHKNFVDIIAICAGKKAYKPLKKNFA